jgi:all-trans-8'-apo-beta-carotenal 15,15'-oxygenase
MTLHLNRRAFLISSLAAAAASAVITPEQVLAGAAPGDWTLGVADVDRDVPLETLRLVQGRMPVGLTGTLFRNGPAKFRRAGGKSGHWFDGDGLVRRFHFDGDKASLNARFVDTPKRRLETKLDAMVVPGFGTLQGKGAKLSGPDDANAANTSVMMSGGELFALHEAGSPSRLNPETLESLGFKTFRSDLKQMPFSAHPRIEPDGTAWNFGGNGTRTAIWKLRPDGVLDSLQMIDLPRASYFHDFTMTARHIIIVLQPWIQERFVFPLSTGMVWHPELGTQVLVLEKADLTKRRVFELPAFSFFHLGDGWVERDGTIRFDGCLEADPTFGQRTAAGLLSGIHIKAPRPSLTQIVLRPDGKAALVKTGIAAEFPASDRRLAGFARRHTAHVTGYRDTPFPHAIAMWDWQRGRDDVHDFGSRQLVDEFLFVPGKGGGERDGWLVGTTLNLDAKATELHVLDAAHLDAGPRATWRASLPLPLTFHGTFRAA